MFKLSSDVLANFRGVQSALRELLDKIADIYRRLRSVEERIDGIPLGSSSSGVTLPIDAVDVDYDNATSGLTATNVQDAIDELAASGGGSDRSAVTALSISSGVVTVDYDDGDYFTLALTENVTGWTIDNLPGAGFGAELQILITQDSTARTVAWPDEWRWEDDTPPSVSTDDGVSDVLRLTDFGVAGIAAYLSKGRTEMIAEEGGGFADYSEYATWADAQTVDNAKSVAYLSDSIYVGYESAGGSITGGMGAGIYRLSIADCDFVLPPYWEMWGSPSSADQYVTYDSGLGAWLVHVFEGSASTGSNQPNKIIVSFDDQSSHTTTGVTKNGYTSSSYSAWTSLRTEYVIYWDYALGKARRYDAATDTYSDFTP